MLTKTKRIPTIGRGDCCLDWVVGLLYRNLFSTYDVDALLGVLYAAAVEVVDDQL